MSHLQGPSKIFLNEPFDCSEDMSTGPLRMMPWPCKKCKKNSSTRAYGEPCWHYEGKIAIAIGTFSFKYILIVHCNIYAMVTWTARGLADLVEDVNKLSCWVSASFAAGSLPGVRKRAGLYCVHLRSQTPEVVSGVCSGCEPDKELLSPDP